MNKKSFGPCLIRISAIFVLSFLSAVPIQGQEKSELLPELLKNDKNKKCGQRGEIIGLGKQLIEKYESDPQKKDVVEYLKIKILGIEREDRFCLRNDRYNNSFISKNWDEFFGVGKEIVAEEGYSPVALDVMLDLVSVGFDRAVVDKIDTYNKYTLYYAKQAIQAIESGQNSQTGKYGVFVPFNTKDDALSWMNYIIGWIMLNKMNQPKEAVTYYYKALQTGAKKNDTTVYTFIGTYYFDEAVRLDTDYREKRRINNNEETDETKALLALARRMAEPAMEAFGRAYNLAVEKKESKQFVGNIYRTLVDLYKFRFNLPEDLRTKELLNDYLEQLKISPMFDPSTTEETIDEKLRRLP